jgi:hypothetical protein
MGNARKGFGRLANKGGIAISPTPVEKGFKRFCPMDIGQ